MGSYLEENFLNFLPLFEEAVKKNFDKLALVDQDGTILAGHVIAMAGFS